MDNSILFFAFAAIVLAGAIGVVVSRNPVHSSLFLVLTMITMAGLFLMLDAPMVAIVQVIVYASAIVVLFLFVIMLLGVDRHESIASDDHRFQRPAAAVLGLAVFGCIIALTGAKWNVGTESTRTVGGVSISAARPDNIVATATKAVERGRGRSRRPPRSTAGPDPVHALRVAVRSHCVAVGRRRRGCGRARPTESTSRTRGGHGMTLASTFVTVTPKYFFVLGALLFTIGATGLLLRKNTIVMFMCVELMLNAVNLTFVTFAKALDDAAGQAAVFFTLIVAAAEVAVGLAIIVAIFRRRQGVTADDIDLLKG